MPAFYLESSALVKRYAAELGSRFVIKLMQPSARNPHYHLLPRTDPRNDRE